LGSLSAAATSTEPRESAYSSALLSVLFGHPPMLMLITSLLRLAATVRALATSEQAKPIFSMKRPQSKPSEATPMPLSVSPQASPAVWLPWPLVSTVGKLAPKP
jgi:hypothetical protein